MTEAARSLAHHEAGDEDEDVGPTLDLDRDFGPDYDEAEDEDYT